MSEARNGASPTLEGIRVVEMGSLLARPFCGRFLADFGAEVIKVEPPGKEDSMCEWGRHRKDGHTLWWPVVARNNVVDVGIYEAMLAFMESTISEYALTGHVRGRTDAILPFVAPSNTYPTRDDDYVVAGANIDTAFAQFAEAAGHPE